MSTAKPLLKNASTALRHFVAREAGIWASTRSMPRQPGHVLVVLCVDTEGDFGRLDAREPWFARPVPRMSWAAYAGRRDVARVMSTWRDRHTDSEESPPRLTWFIRADLFEARAGGRTLVLEALRQRFGRALAAYGDELAWHHHHMVWTGAPAETGGWVYDRDYTRNRDHEAALAALVIDGGLFPSAFRAGALMLTDDLNRWLEGYVPFDYTLLVSPRPRRSHRKDHLREAFDWTRAPNDWSWYHSSLTDYQRPGTMRRAFFPCTDAARALESAFVRAAARGEEVVAGVYTHDSGPLIPFLLSVLRTLQRLSRRFGVSYQFMSASEASRRALGWRPSPWTLTVRLQPASRFLEIGAPRPLFGPTPFVGLRRGDLYQALPVQRLGGGLWQVRVPGEGPATVGVGACDAQGTPAHHVLTVPALDATLSAGGA